MEQKNAIIERIKKFLALAESENENEAKLAMERANDLLLRFNLTQQEISDSNTAAGIKDQFSEESYSKLPVEEKFISSILREHFFVDVLYNTQRMRWEPSVTRLRLIGTQTNIDVAFYVFGFLMIQYRQLWKAYKKQTHAPASAKQSYYRGLTMGICHKLDSRKKIVQQETGLVWVGDKAINNYIEKQFGDNLKNKTPAKLPPVDRDVAFDGLKDGHKLELTKALKQDEKAVNNKLLLKG